MSDRSILEILKTSIMAKMVMVAILALLLLLPTVMVTDIIRERQGLNQETINKVSREWAARQLVEGPVLTLPKGKTGTPSRTYLQVLPETLEVRGKIRPKELHRGIYDVIVYEGGLTISGTFRPIRAIADIDTTDVRWEEAFLTIGVSDMKGIAELVEATWGGQGIEVDAGSSLRSLINRGMTIRVGDRVLLGEEIPFTIDLKLQGSRELSFLPLGRTTRVEIDASWPSPGFIGAFLPDVRNITDTGFSATWTILEANRQVPSSWEGTTMHALIDEGSFGVRLVPGVNDYQKSIRSVKYAILVIALTFLVFFLVEVTGGRKVHPFQYAMVGLALSLFYLLLVALSEVIGFNPAYGVAGGVITGMITLYSIPIFRSTKKTLLLALTLILTYSFLFVLLQLEEYALLVGSLGLALLLGGTMFFTRNVDWYGEGDGR